MFPAARLVVFLCILNAAAGSESLYGWMTYYVSLIADVFEHYRTTAVFMCRPSTISSNDIAISLALNKWTILLSKHGISMQHVKFRYLNETTVYQNELVRPVYIVLLVDKTSVMEFVDVARRVNLFLPTWFAVFLLPVVIDGIDYCHRPPGNVFNLAISTEMLVLCHGDSVLREWYALRDNRTRFNDLATWSPSTGLTILTNKTAAERRTAGGVTLHAVIVKDNPFVTLKNGTLTGYFGKILEALSETMNFTFVVREVAHYGVWNRKDSRWSGAMNELVANRADIGVADFSITGHRSNRVDFLLPLMLSKICLYIKEPGTTEIQWSAFFRTFRPRLWFVVLLIIIVAPCIIALLNTRRSTRDLPRSMLDSYLGVWGIFCQQGLSEFPKSTPARLAYFSIFASALVVSAAYSASLISSLTIHIPSLPFLSLHEFVKDGTYKLLVMRDTTDHETFLYLRDSVLRKARDMMEDEEKLPSSLSEAFHRLCTEQKVAFYTSAVAVRTGSFEIPCKVFCIDVGRTDSISMMLTKRNLYTSLINRQLQKFFNSGILNRFKGSNFEMPRDDDVAYTAVDLRSVAPVLSMYASGLVLSVMVLRAEIRFVHYSRQGLSRAIREFACDAI